MSLIFDIVIIAVCLCTVIAGTKRGFIKSVMNLGANIVSLIAAYAFYPRLAAFIRDNWLQNALSDGISATIKGLSSSGSGNAVTYDLSRLFSDMPDAFMQILNRYHKDPPELEALYGNASSVSEPAVDSLATAISSSVAGVLSNIAAFAIIFFASLLVLTIITMILDAVFKLPVLKTANTFLGLIFGVVCAVFLAWLMSTVSSYLIGALSSVYPNYFNDTTVQNSIILKFFTENNLLSMITFK